MPPLDCAFAFTERDTEPLRARIAADLDAITTRIAEQDPRLVALILTGGFSRGEGTARNGRPINDYDLVAVRSSPGARALYADLSVELTRRVRLEVDVMPIARARLPRVGRKLFWLDARLGGRILHGDERVLGEIRDFDARRVHASEPARLLGNRAAGLLLALPGEGEVVDSTQRDLQATKAVLAAMDASLLARGQYAPRLRERLQLARDVEDAPIYARAVDWKLGGATSPMGESWWFEARDALLRAVDRTRAEARSDGAIEIVVHALRAKRIRLDPSARIRREAWSLLRRGPPAESWPAVKKSFFQRRAATLQ